MSSATDREADMRARIQQHREASERGDVDAEHAIYAADAVLDYPQSGERLEAGQASKRNAAGIQPNATSPSAGSWAPATCG
jgi:ketosteroid isomerase-like protein